MEWVLIFEMILELLKRLQEGKDDNVLLAHLRKPGAHEMLALRRVLRKKGLRRKELRAAMREGMTALAEMDDEELASVLEDARES